MRKYKTADSFIGLCAGCLLILAASGHRAEADYLMPCHVVGTGGGLSSGQSRTMNATMGQTFCGSLTGAALSYRSGFWAVVQHRTGTVFVEHKGLPGAFRLLGNYPNPFNPATAISFELPKRADVTLKVYSVSGQLVSTLLDGELPAGRYRAIWEPESVGAGVYLFSLETGDTFLTGKMLYLK